MQYYFKHIQGKTLLPFIAVIFMLTTAFNNTNKPNKQTITILYDTNSFLPGKDTIAYRPDYTLQWSDFEGMAPANLTDNTVANSAVGFKYNALLRSGNGNEHITIKVSSFFIRSKSWGIAKEKNEHILKHEIIHFKIARYGAELFKNYLKKEKINRSNLNAVLTNAYENAWNDYTRLQDQYDRETMHSMNKKQQAAWEKYIDKLMKKCRYN